MLIECVPNFSEGKNKEVISEIENAIKAVTGVDLIDIEYNESHNRSVFTMIGDFQSVKKAMMNAAEIAIKRIDLTHHKGEHPRMGAVDVIPFVPVEGCTMEEVIAFSKEFAKEYAEKFEIPVFLYANSASIPEHEDLANVRKGEFEGLRDIIGKDPLHIPDFGPKNIHPTAGTTAIGARPFLVAYNIYLSTGDVKVAKEIAKRVRNKDGGLRYAKALGFYIKERNQAQVSMNLVNFKGTTLHMATEMVKIEAERFGVNTVEGEIVGEIPVDALIDASMYYLKLNNFNKDQILETKIEKVRNSSLRNLRIPTFVDKLSNNSPTPGGGSAAALVASLGISLIIMATSISNKDKDISKLALLRDNALVMIDKDSQSFDEFMSARKSHPDNEELRKQAMETALIHAAESPLNLMKLIKEALKLCKEYRNGIKSSVISDLYSGLHLLNSSALSAMENVKINLKYLKNEEINKKLKEESESILQEITTLYNELLK